MSIKYDRVSVSPGVNVASRINQELQKIQEALERALDRLGDSPNAMESDLDMGLNDIINANSIDIKKLLIDGEEVDFASGGGGGSQQEIDDILATISSIQSQLDSLGTAAYTDTGILFNRENHTGTQSISTIEGLQGILNSLQDAIDNLDVSEIDVKWGDISGNINLQEDLIATIEAAIGEPGSGGGGEPGSGGSEGFPVVVEEDHYVVLGAAHRNRVVVLSRGVHEVMLGQYLFEGPGDWVRVISYPSNHATWEDFNVEVHPGNWTQLGMAYINSIAKDVLMPMDIYYVGGNAVHFSGAYVDGPPPPTFSIGFTVNEELDGEFKCVWDPLGLLEETEAGTVSGDTHYIMGLVLFSEDVSGVDGGILLGVTDPSVFGDPSVADLELGQSITIHDHDWPASATLNGVPTHDLPYGSYVISYITDPRDGKDKYVFELPIYLPNGHGILNTMEENNIDVYIDPDLLGDS